MVGNVANALFGVLDSEYATQMSQTIQRLDNDQNHIIELLKNQTSIIDSTVNIIKVDQEAVKRKFDVFDKSLNEIQNHIRATIEDEKLLHSMFSIALHLIMTNANIHRMQAVMIDVLTDVHHGQIGPLLLSPNQLRDELIKIKAHMSPSMQLPAQNEDLLTLYKLMTVEAGLTHTHVLFKIMLPLLDINEFNVYNVLPIPTLVNGTLVVLKPTTSILAITAHGDNYYPLTLQQYNNCLKVGKQTRLCAHIQTIYNKGSTAHSCEVNVFNNETKLSCDVIKAFHSQWTQMANKNQWLFSLTESVKMTGVCGNNVQHIVLDGSGILKIGSECTIKNNRFTLIGHQTLHSTTNISITSHGQWEHLENPETAEPVLLEDAIEPYSAEFNELTALQKMIKEQHIDQLHNKWQITQHHFLGVGYSALILGTIIGVYLIVTRKHSQRTNPLKNESTPTPAPRHDFSIHV